MRELKRVLLAEDSAKDVEMTLAAWKRNHLTNPVVVARDGVEALDYLFRRGKFENRAVHEDVQVDGHTRQIQSGALLHHSYPTLSDYIEHMNRYSSLGAEMVVAKGPVKLTVVNITLRPLATFIYNYFFRLGFLDGREGLLLHLNHAVYVSWKYAKAWELSRNSKANP